MDDDIFFTQPVIDCETATIYEENVLASISKHFKSCYTFTILKGCTC